ncbi:MAG: hypothetical protein JWL92_676 [Candidatus Nomurabacteria bacterium]|nr:hypothetical protein [Candidatus Nomurabacteria bacterium]
MYSEGNQFLYIMKINKAISTAILSISVVAILGTVFFQNPVVSCIAISTISLMAFQIGVTVADDYRDVEETSLKEWILFSVYTVAILFTYKVFVCNIYPHLAAPNRKLQLYFSFIGITWFVPFYAGHYLKRFSIMNRIFKFEV